jgi:hypothetical protein
MAFAKTSDKSLQKRAISAPNIFLLKITVYDGTEVLRVDCPKIRTIRVSTINYLKVNGVLFQELSLAVVGLQIKCRRNAIGLTLDSSFCGEDYNFFAQRFLEIVGSFKAFKKP